MLAIATLLIVIIFSLLITRIATIVLAHTGLSKDVAQFQSRSAFTGVGFTTLEAEKIVNHPLRRRVIMVLMLLGNAGFVTVMSSLVLSFVGVDQRSAYLNRILFLLAGLVVLWRLSSSHWVDKKLSYYVNKILSRYTSLDTQDYTSLLHLGPEYRVIELTVDPRDWIADHRLAELRLPDYKIQVLGLTRKNGEYLGAPDGETLIKPHDTLTLYGQRAILASMDWENEPECVSDKALVCRRPLLLKDEDDHEKDP